MRRIVLSKLIAAVIALSAAEAHSGERLALSEGSAAQPTAGETQVVVAPAWQRRALAGSWLMPISITGGPTFRSLVTFAKDGSLVSYDQGSVLLNPSFPRQFSAGHGVWEHRQGHSFNVTTLAALRLFAHRAS